MKKILCLTIVWTLFMSITGLAQALPLINGNFDADVGLTEQNWGVYASINGWTKGDGTAGIEVQRGTVVQADSLYQYVELDSHGGKNTNSSMYQPVFLEKGLYELSWMYYARTNGGGDDNKIRAFVTDQNALEIFSESISRTRNEQYPLIWEHVSWTFAVHRTDNYNLWFEALGNANRYGGFIDSVSLTNLTEVPEPATVFLFGAGLAGLAGIIRRKV